MTYDSSIPQQVVQSVEKLIRRDLERRSDVVLVAEEYPLTAQFASQAPSRRSMIARGRQTRADYAADVRLTRVQLTLGSRFTLAQAWVVSPDSGAYVIVTETSWPPNDTLAMRRQMGLLMGRLIPPASDTYCYVELEDQGVRRDSTYAVQEARIDLRVRTSRHALASHARIWGHWVINANAEAPETITTDASGVAHLSFEASRSARPIGDAIFVVDSVRCTGAVYDQQWPQREVDQAIALLEDARADLDEDQAYDRAIAKVQQFNALDERDVEWYPVLMTPLNAPDRRQQALNLLRRAQAEKRRSSASMAAERKREERWAYGAWFGYDMLQPREGTFSAQPVGCDTCSDLVLSSENIRRADFGVLLRYRVFSHLWVSTGGSWSYGRVQVATQVANTRTLSSTTFVASLWIPRALQSEALVYGEVGMRLTKRTEEKGLRYWVQGKPYDEHWSVTWPIYNPPAPGEVFREPDPPTGFRPGAEVACGVSLRLSDWSPIWAHTDLRGLFERTGNGRGSWRISLRFGASYWR